MKLSIPLADGRILVYEGTHEELVQIGEDFVARFGAEITTTQQAQSLGGVTVHAKWSGHKIKKLLSLLYGDQAKLVKFLVEQGGTSPYTQVAKHMGYDAQRLSGILSPITRNAQAATGDREARLIDWRIDDSGTRQYFIHPDALPFLTDGVGNTK